MALGPPDAVEERWTQLEDVDKKVVLNLTPLPPKDYLLVFKFRSAFAFPGMDDDDRLLAVTRQPVC